MEVKILQLDKELSLPKYETDGSAGMDLYSTKNTWIIPGQISVISTGIAISLPKGYEAQIRPRSGLAAKHGITVVNAPGTIDSDYRGEIKIILTNLSRQQHQVLRGNRIAQMVINRVEQINWLPVETGLDLEQSERGSGGFGSTGL
jgi:dUTP pyrophosphatase